MADDAKDSIPSEIEKTLIKLDLDIDLLRPITDDDILYLLDRCPFLQIVSSGSAAPLPQVELVTAKTNWVIHYYGDAMSSSPGRLLFQGGDFHILLQDDDGASDGGGLINPGKGTIWKQAFDTAQEMMALAQKLGWAGVKIIDGHSFMQWAAWMYAQDERMHLEGYEPDKEAHNKRIRVKRSEIEDIAQIDIYPSSRT